MDEVIKNVLIPISDLPLIPEGQTNYIIRYRIVSEDKNRASAWTPLIVVQDSQES